MSVDNLLHRLGKVKSTGRHQWNACCPAHNDRSPSLSIRETETGTVLIHCFGGCSVHEVLGAVGMEVSDLFPKSEHGRPERKSFPAAQVLQAIGHEVRVIVQCARALLDHKPFSDDDRKRMMLAVERITNGLDAAGVI